jgi:hypothetical protein
MRYSREYLITMLAAVPGVLCCSGLACLQVVLTGWGIPFLIVPLAFLIFAPGLPLLALTVARLMPDPFRYPVQWLWLPVAAAASLWHIVVFDASYRWFGEPMVQWSWMIPQGLCMAFATVMCWGFARARLTNRCDGLAMKPSGVDNPVAASH